MIIPKICPRYEMPDACSSPRCPLLEGGMSIFMLKGEEECPYCSSKKGVRKTIPTKIIEFLPKENIRHLNKNSKNKAKNINKKVEPTNVPLQ
jgi:hypothetical protein